MPAYEAERTIDLAIRSVLGQSRGDFELVVVDNGSTDGTVGRVEQFLDDGRVRLIHEANRGAAAARNAGIAAARGRYVSFLDSDDLFLPDFLESMAAVVESSGADVAYTDGWAFDEATGRIFRRSAMSSWRPRTPPESPEAFFRELLRRGNFVLVSVLLERALLARVGGFRLGLDPSEDWELWLRLSASGCRFAASRRKLVVYRRRAGQLTGDALFTMRATLNVYRIVAEEYDVHADARRLAEQQRDELDRAVRSFEPRRPRRIPRALRLPYRALWLVKWFRLTPPRRLRPFYRELRRNSRAVAATSRSMPRETTERASR
jgi:glycosyltransferase involved in cell wall biosynthesis